MLTPEGESADNTDKIMLLAMWVHTLAAERTKNANAGEYQPIISAGMGKPTFAINQHTIQAQIAYWKYIEERVKAIASDSAAIGYGDPHGDVSPRSKMAEAMSKWYDTAISAENILFTVGGAGALRVIFETFNSLYQDLPKYRVITPFPYYTLYADNRHTLHPIDVMKNPGYKLTAESLQLSIEEANRLAEKDGGYPKALLLCNPNNPLGTVIDEEELRKIADVLRTHKDLHIVLDEAYAEMCFDVSKAPSLLSIAPDLKDRVTILRSATKALSAAGERMAVLMAFDKSLMAKFLDKNISTIGHAPRSAQIAYAETMAHFTNEEHQQLISFYRPKAEYVTNRLQAMGAAMPDPEYKASATFYALADLNDLMGIELPEDTARALGKTGKIETSEDLTYYLLFKDSIMIAPLAYYGVPKNIGFMRITCSESEEVLEDLMNRIEARLFEARCLKKITFMNDLSEKLSILKDIDPINHDKIVSKMMEALSLEENCLNLKLQNQVLKELSSSATSFINRANEPGREKAAIVIQSYFRRHLAQITSKNRSDEVDKTWKEFVKKMAPDSPKMQAYFLSLSNSERLNFVPWVDHLKTINDSDNGSRPLVG